MLSDEAWGYDASWKPLPVTGYFSKKDWVRAKADAVVLGSTIDVIDFKTGKKRAVSEDQVRFYGLLALLRYAKAKGARLHLWYTDAGKIVDDLPLVKRSEVAALQKDYETRAVKHIYDERDFKPTPGDHCGWCPFSRFKGGPCKF